MSFDFDESVFELLADRKVKEAMDEGVFDNLPGKGKPLKLDEDFLVPPALRAAFRIMKNADVLPEWMEQAKLIQKLREELNAFMLKLEKEYPIKSQMGLAIFRAWYKEIVQDYQRRVLTLNRQILKYQLLAPPATRVELPLQFEPAFEQFLTDFPPPQGLDARLALKPKR